MPAETGDPVATEDRGALEGRLAQVQAELQRVESGGTQNWQWSREWFDLHNERSAIEASLGRLSGAPSE